MLAVAVSACHLSKFTFHKKQQNFMKFLLATVFTAPTEAAEEISASHLTFIPTNLIPSRYERNTLI